MEDIESEVQQLEEIDELDNIDIGLSDDAMLIIAAQERYQIAVSYQRLKVRRDTTSASVTANKSVGNDIQAKKFEEQLVEINTQLAHCLRGIKTIDKEYPKAKTKMQEIKV